MYSRFRRRGLMSLLACCFSLSALADYSPVAPGVSFDAVLALPVGQPAATLRYGNAPPQYGELWLPAPEPSAAGSPLVVFIHGGCWLNQYGVDHSRPLASALTAKGYAVWAIEYRRVGDPGGGWPGSFEDIRAALRLLVESHPEGVDLQRAVLSGHSAGGHLALLLAAELAADPQPALGLRGVFGLAPITDIARYAEGSGSCNRGAVQFMGDAPSERAAEYAAANPVGRQTLPGTVILLGQEDPIIPYQLPELGPHTLVAEPAGHFDWVHPGTPAWRRWLLELERLLK